MLEMPFIFMHGLDDLVDQQHDAVAAFGDGVASRKTLLGYLSLRHGLLALRATSRAARLLVQEATFDTKPGSVFSPSLAHPEKVFAIQAAFPRATSLFVIQVDVTLNWGLQDIARLAQSSDISVHFHKNCNSGLIDALNVLKGRCKCISIDSLQDLSLASMPVIGGDERGQHSEENVTPGDHWAYAIHKLWLQTASEVHSLCSFYSTQRQLSGVLLSPRLHTLTLAGESVSEVTHSDLAPLAPHLRTLLCIRCRGITRWEGFTSLEQLYYDGDGAEWSNMFDGPDEQDGQEGQEPALSGHASSLDPNGLPSSLRQLLLANVRLTAVWDVGLARLTHLQSLRLEGVRGLHLSPFCKHLPPSTHHLRVSRCRYAAETHSSGLSDVCTIPSLFVHLRHVRSLHWHYLMLSARGHITPDPDLPTLPPFAWRSVHILDDVFGLSFGLERMDWLRLHAPLLRHLALSSEHAKFHFLGASPDLLLTALAGALPTTLRSMRLEGFVYSLERVRAVYAGALRCLTSLHAPLAVRLWVKAHDKEKLSPAVVAALAADLPMGAMDGHSAYRSTHAALCTPWIRLIGDRAAKLPVDAVIEELASSVSVLPYEGTCTLSFLWAVQGDDGLDEGQGQQGRELVDLDLADLCMQ